MADWVALGADNGLSGNCCLRAMIGCGDEDNVSIVHCLPDVELLIFIRQLKLLETFGSTRDSRQNVRLQSI